MLENKFNQLCLSPSDINEHLPVIRDCAKECETIIELGVRVPISTFALMMGKPKKLTSVDLLHPNHFPGGDYELKLAYEYAKQENIDFSFVLNDSISYSFDKCDLLFIDTWHTYRQLVSELIIHQQKVTKYIILHDTTTYAVEDEANWARSPEPNFEGEIKKGLWTAVEDFLLHFPDWELHKRYTNNNGLSILKRKNG
jgi:hypothetical protein